MPLFMGIISPQGQMQLWCEWQKGALGSPMASASSRNMKCASLGKCARMSERKNGIQLIGLP